MPEESTRASQAVKTGKLPARRPDHPLEAPVSEGSAVCERPVSKDAMEFEIEFAQLSKRDLFPATGISSRDPRRRASSGMPAGS